MEAMMSEPEPRYTPDEFFDFYFDFLKDARIQRKLTQRGIRTWEHEELLFRFIAYVKNVEFIAVKQGWEARKMAEIPEETKRFQAWREQQRRERDQRGRELHQSLLKSREVTERTIEHPMFGEPTDGTLFTEEEP
jgi:hypothetical protein